jgi:outer membrane beta-barrel protein
MERIIKTFIVGCSAILLTSYASGSWAQGQKDKAEKKKTAGDRVDISDLENKYWAPKDTDFKVVQNRLYTKEGRFSLSASLGILVNDPYNSAWIYDLTGNYYFSERFGAEFSYQKVNPEYGEVVANLEDFAGGGTRPDFSQLNAIYEAGFNYVPFYAKVSVLGKRIIYFDMMITPTLGVVQYDQELEGGNKSQSAFSYGFNISQHFFLSKRLTIRADLKNRWFDEKRTRWREVDRKELGSVYNNTSTFSLGVQFFF